MKLILAAAIAAVIASAPAQAQTANGSPTAPAPGGASGAPSTSTTGPSGGTTTLPSTGRSAIGAPTKTEQQEQQKSDQDVQICKGC